MSSRPARPREDPLTGGLCCDGKRGQLNIKVRREKVLGFFFFLRFLFLRLHVWEPQELKTNAIPSGTRGRDSCALLNAGKQTSGAQCVPSLQPRADGTFDRQRPFEQASNVLNTQVARVTALEIVCVCV